MNEPDKRIFFSLFLRPTCFLPNDSSQFKILYGYNEGKYCQYWALRTLCYESKKRRFDESFVEMLFEFLILLDADLGKKVSFVQFDFIRMM